MKIKLNKDNLINSIQTVQNVVSPKATLPILSNMLLETQGETVKFNSTDLDIGISCQTPAHIYEEGAITIPAKRFSDIIRELPPGEVVIHARKNNHVEIEGNNCRFKLIGLPKEEFPKFPEFDDKNVISLHQKDLKEMIKMTAFAVSHEESRYVLNGLLFEITKSQIKVIATDGRRLAKIERTLTKPVKQDINVIIPIKAIHEVNRNLMEDGEVFLTFGTNQILFNIDGVLIATRVIEGEFPNYRQVIPSESEKKIRLETADFLSAIKRANLLSTPDFQAIKFEVFKDKLIVSKSTPDIGESREELPIKYGGNEMIVGFNPSYMIDVLKNINDDEIHFEILGPDKPCMIRQDDYLYLALPMRI